MRILFTGGSSFTGYWFIRELARAGHSIVATFRQPPEGYSEPLRAERVRAALDHCTGVFGCSFGDAEFIALARREHWDLVCHHAADVTDYKSPDFDVVRALQNNTRCLPAVLGALAQGSRRKPGILLTGSVFENDEGAGSEGLPAFSPYGLSKGLTYQAFRYYALRAGFALGKFVVPNPFGPWEEPRFTAYLIRTWLANGTAVVNTPDYVRDNIHVGLLAAAYAAYAATLPRACGVVRISPSGFVESQGAFAQRFAAAMRPRLGLPCDLELKRQEAFPEPRVRIGTDPVDTGALHWDDTAAWDGIASFYRRPPPPGS